MYRFFSPSEAAFIFIFLIFKFLTLRNLDILSLRNFLRHHTCFPNLCSVVSLTSHRWRRPVFFYSLASSCLHVLPAPLTCNELSTDLQLWLRWHWPCPCGRLSAWVNFTLADSLSAFCGVFCKDLGLVWNADSWAPAVVSLLSFCLPLCFPGAFKPNTGWEHRDSLWTKKVQTVGLLLFRFGFGFLYLGRGRGSTKPLFIRIGECWALYWWQ